MEWLDLRAYISFLPKSDKLGKRDKTKEKGVWTRDSKLWGSN